MAKDSAETTKGQKFLHILFDVFFAVVILICIVIALVSIIYIYIPVSGESMRPTINTYGDTDNVYINRFNKGKKGDIIVVDTKEMRENEHVYVIKRLIASSGDRIKLVLDQEGYVVVYINGQPLREDYVNLKDRGEDDRVPWNYENFYAYMRTNKDSIDWSEKEGLLIPENSVFIMGDNRGREKSLDSCKYGPVHVEDIIGKVDVLVRNGEGNIKSLFNYFLMLIGAKERIAY